MNVKKLIRKALKGAKGSKLGRGELERVVVAQLVAEGKKEKKAAKLFAEKLDAEACFVVKGSSVKLAKDDATETTADARDGCSPRDSP